MYKNQKPLYTNIYYKNRLVYFDQTAILIMLFVLGCINSKYVFNVKYEVQTRNSQEMKSMRVDHGKSIKLYAQLNA